MKKIEAVIFDWAGTTVDYGSFAPVQAFIEAFGEFGITPTVAEVREPMGMLKWDHIHTMMKMPRITEEWKKAHGRMWDKSDVDAIYKKSEKAIFGILDKFSTPKPFVPETIFKLKKRGIKIGSTTGYTTEMMDIVTKSAAEQGYKDKTQMYFAELMEMLPSEHKAKWLAGAALNSSDQAMLSVMSTALSRLNSFLDSEMEQILCFGTAIDAEKFCSEKCAVFVILPEEDQSKYFMVSLLIQQLYREILSIADEKGGTLDKRVMFYCDELGTFPKIDGLEAMFSAGRSRKISIVAIIQSFAQLEQTYGKQGMEIITDNTQLTVFGGFAPNSQSAEVLSKALGEQTVLSGSVSHGREQSKSLQMIGRPLMTVDELKSMPKGQFIVMKTGTHPMISKLKLYFKWGITFGNPYLLPDKGARAVRYLERDELMREIAVKYPQKKKVLPPPEAEVEIVDEHEPQPHKPKVDVKTGGR